MLVLHGAVEMFCGDRWFVCSCNLRLRVLFAVILDLLMLDPASTSCSVC